MARIRSIKPDFWTDEKVVELSSFARLLFIGLWNFADDDGRLVHSPKRLKMQIFPSDSVDMSELLGEIRREKLIDIYVIDSIEYLQVINFDKHQKIDKRTASKLPANPNYQPTPSNPPELPRIPTTEGKGMEGNGRDMEKEGNGSLTTANAVVGKIEFSPPDCPHQKIVDLWHEQMPELARVAAWNDTRKSYLRSRWREVCASNAITAEGDGIEWFKGFFQSIRSSKFLMGHTPPKPNQKPFLVDLEWALRPSNFIKIIEGKYHQ